MPVRSLPGFLTCLLGLLLLATAGRGGPPPGENLLTLGTSAYQIPAPHEIPYSAILDAPTLEDILDGRWQDEVPEPLPDPDSDLLGPPPGSESSPGPEESEGPPPEAQGANPENPIQLASRSLPEAPPRPIQANPGPSPPPGAHRKPGTVRIASWNMLNLSKPRNLERRAEVIAHFDLVALQEVKRPATLNKLRKLLQKRTGVTWHREVSERVGKGQKAERMAFLYRIDRVKAVRGRHSKGVLRPEKAGAFTRPPYYATFRAGKFDFVLISYHARWGRGSEITREVSQLGELYRKLQGKVGSERDIILAGDFNRDGPTHPAFYSLEQAGMRFLVEDEEGSFTTYSDMPEKIGASFYDNLWAPSEHTSEFTGVSGILYLHDRFFQEEDYPHLLIRSAISDHCPVWAEFATTRDDD